MKTVYTLTEEQFKWLESMARGLRRDTSSLPATTRGTYGDVLHNTLDDVASTATAQVEPSDRQKWQGTERRRFDRRVDINVSADAQQGRKSDTIDQNFAIFGRRFPVGGR